jgi:8-oxo-dGTP pyrophosphatase MutT (NUDIX family)
MWDLPKGKIDKGESAEDAAIREVIEETGINRLKITGELPSTFHLFMLKDRLALKESIWFRMRCESNREPVPQLKERITRAEWKSRKIIKKLLPDAYGSIAALLKSAL